MTTSYIPARVRNLFQHDLGPWHDDVEQLAATLSATAIERDKAGGTALAERQAIRKSGLLKLRVRDEAGVPREGWPRILRMVRRLAAVDGSLGHLFAFQHLQLETIAIFGRADQQQRFFHATDAQDWFWGNATNDRDTRLALVENDGRYYLDGIRFFCSGSVDSDALIVNVPHPAADGPRLFLAIPTSREGVTLGRDWNAIGQRQTDSGSIAFNRVPVLEDEFLGWAPGEPFAPRLPRHTIRSCLAQLILTEIYVGNTEGALEAALDYVGTRAKPWPAGAASVLYDPLLQLRFGEHWAAYQAARSLADEAALALQDAWDRWDALSAEERGALALKIAQARVTAAETGLRITSAIFDQAGASATASALGLDRFWRNIRVHSLHDPLDGKRQALGAWLLKGEVPVPSGYA